MSYEEALKVIENVLQAAIREWDDPTDEHQRERAVVLQRAKDAIEKQIPKQPKIDRYTYMNGSGYFDELRCPTCNNYLIQKDDFGDCIEGSMRDHCEDCGQKIKWREEGK